MISWIAEGQIAANHAGEGDPGMESQAISANLQRLRHARGMSQQSVAATSGISRVAYRSIEKGESVPKYATLDSIARALDAKPEDLLAPVRTIKTIRFRAQKKMKRRDQVVADVTRWLDDFNDLERRLHDRVGCDRLMAVSNRLARIKDRADRPVVVANEARKALGLADDEPVRDICGLLESAGVKVFPRAVASEGFFGLSVGPSEGGPAIVVNVWDRISVERWIFSAAHELGHLLMHLDAYDVSESREDKREEIEANVFAGHFLMPEPVFRREWQYASGLPFVDRVLKVKRIFRVSYKTVLYRLVSNQWVDSGIWARFQGECQRRYGKTLCRTDEPEALLSDAFFVSAPEAHRAHEPDQLTKSDFVEGRLPKLVRRAIEAEEISLSRGAEILRLDLQAMRRLTASWAEESPHGA